MKYLLSITFVVLTLFVNGQNDGALYTELSDTLEVRDTSVLVEYQSYRNDTLIKKYKVVWGLPKPTMVKVPTLKIFNRTIFTKKQWRLLSKGRGKDTIFNYGKNGNVWLEIFDEEGNYTIVGERTEATRISHTPTGVIHFIFVVKELKGYKPEN
jgi:hypothetical protein